MDRWKSKGGKTQRREEKKNEDQRRERVRGKTMQMQVREKVAKWRNIVFFQWFVAPEGRKVGSLKRRVRSHLARWEMKSCMPLCHKAHLEVKSVKNWRSQYVSVHFWKLRCRKSARRCGAKHISKSKCTNHTRVGALLEVEMSKKCTPMWRKAHFQVKMYKTHQVRNNFGRSDVVSRGRRKGLCTLSKVGKSCGFPSISKNDGRRGTFEEDLDRCIFPGNCNTRDIFIRAVRRSGRSFPEMGCILEHQIFSFAKTILCDRCRTLYDLASLFRGRRNTSETWTGKNAKRIGTRPSALHSTFHYWSLLKKSRKIASFLMLPTSNIEEVSQNFFGFDVANFESWRSLQNCFVFDVIKFKSWGSLTELLRFSCCHLRKWRKSRRIASFSSSQIDRKTNR